MRAALIAVASAPPKRFAGGGFWEAMKGEMTGWFEVRVDGPGRHHYQLFCCSTTTRWVRLATLGCDRRPRQAIPDDAVGAGYAAVRHLGDEYRSRSPRSLA